MVRLIESSATALRLAEARAFIDRHAPHGDLVIVAASRGAADDLARAIAVRSGAAIGLHRFSFTQLAARLAAPVLADRELAPSSYLATEAVAARAAFDATRESSLSYFGPVAAMPGFPRALARTLQEIRLANVTAGGLGSLPLGGPDLADLLERFEAQFAAASAIDRATLFEAATRGLEPHTNQGGQPPHTTPPMLASAPLVLLDVPLDSPVEFAFVQALIGSGQPERPVLITVPFGDLAALKRLESIGLRPEVLEEDGDRDLVALRRTLFATRQPPVREPRGDVTFYSAPGEGRECVEIARRVLQEARAGVPFDDIAVFLRSPDRYTGLLEHALARAGVPAWFDRGTRRPHPGGRAFLAILACACERLSARRFAEYLSLGQVPTLEEAAQPPAFVPPDDEALGAMVAAEPVEETAAATLDVEASEFSDVTPSSDTSRPALLAPRPSDVGSRPWPVALHPSEVDSEAAVVHGTLRAPWKWETLIVESAVIGGDPARWHRRLNGLAREYQVRLAEERKEDPDSARAARLERDWRNLGHLRAFALPIIDRLASWPSTSTWGEWLDRFAEVAPLVLRQPDRVQRVIEQLRPMSAIGPVPLDQARDVIADRLRSMEIDPPKSRYGRVFVGSPHQARGRAFRVVFVAGLAERMFPQRPHEDPMLLDAEMRLPLEAGLVVQEDRGRTERLLLRLAVGAATERLWLSYPRIEIAESRPRVPSFYALDVMRAITGQVPKHEALQEGAALAGGAGLAWPAPAEPSTAIDDLEHDLAVLRQLLQVEPRARVRGHAHYLLRLNDALKRSVTARWARGRSMWTAYDGITRLTGMTRPMLETQRLAARPYSLSALQKFAACPYQFLLSAIYRLEPTEEPEPLQKLDPLTRGSIFHEMQATFFRALKKQGRLPLTERDMAHALATLDAAIIEVADRYHEQLAPAIERVWADEIADLARDLHVWVRRLPQHAGWEPLHFEFAFGLPDDEGRDPASLPDPVLVDGRFKLRGSIDLIERKSAAATRILRITDHKTGRNRTTWKTVIGGGAILQPVLYSVAVEQALDTQVESGRLFYCTSAGGFVEHEIPINEATRRAGLEALEIVDRAIELGFLPAAPHERACTWCDFRSVCGPDEPRRVAGKPREKLADLEALREMP